MNNSGIKKLEIYAKKNKEICKYFMTYSYNDQEDITIKKNKWVVVKLIVNKCEKNILKDILDKQLNIMYIDLCDEFNQPIEALSNCTQLQQLTFGICFDQPIDKLEKSLPNVAVMCKTS